MVQKTMTKEEEDLFWENELSPENIEKSITEMAFWMAAYGMDSTEVAAIIKYFPEEKIRFKHQFIREDWDRVQFEVNNNPFTKEQAVSSLSALNQRVLDCRAKSEEMHHVNKASGE